MNKHFLLIIGLVCSGQLLKAQFNFAQIQNQQTHNLAAAQLPSLLGDDTKNLEVYLFNPYLGFANNVIAAADIEQLSGSGNLSNAYLDDLLAKMPKQGTVWAGADIPLLNVFFNINKKGNTPFLSFGLGMREKIDFNLNLNKDLLSLVYKGNKQFAGQTINLSPSVNFLFYNEYFLAAAGNFQVKVPGSKIKLIGVKPALRLRYLTGLASVYMPDASIDMYTDPEGRFIRMQTKLEANMSSSVDTPDVESTLGDVKLSSMKGPGKGFGIDLGVGVTLLDRLQLHAALTDIGRIRFTKNTINYRKNASYTYEGVNLDENEEDISTSDFEQLIQPEKTYESYDQGLPTRFILSGFYGSGKKTRRKVDYYAHNVSFTYVQGFKNYLSATVHPAFNIAYAYNLKNMLNIGLGFTFGGLNKIQTGAQMGLRLGAVKLGFASNNLLPLIDSRSGRGTDFNAYLGFYF